MKVKKHPNQNRLKELFSFDENSGKFQRITTINNKSKKGEILNGCLSDSGYLLIGVDGKSYRYHRLIWIWVYGDIPDGFQIDHINGIRNDNRICNLRLATNQENSQNIKVKSYSSTGLIGVKKMREKFQARIRINGITTHIGTFNTPEEAHNAYLIEKEKNHLFYNKQRY